jgi:hypothetical protein
MGEGERRDPVPEQGEAPLCAEDLGLGLYSDERCIDPYRCQFWGYCLRCPETADPVPEQGEVSE